jgi:hypothetical protein
MAVCRTCGYDPAAPITLEQLRALDPELLAKLAGAALGQRGGYKGGKARAASLSPEERRAASQAAARARWNRPKE